MTPRVDSICGDGRRRSWEWSLGVVVEVNKPTRLIVRENKRMGILVRHTGDEKRQGVEEEEEGEVDRTGQVSDGTV